MTLDAPPPRRTRLRRHNWLEAGLSALGEAGHSALQAEPLARRLGTTKGSFYWHFDDIPAFHTAILETWEEGAARTLDTAMESEKGDVARLRRFGQVIADRPGGPDPEPAIGAWALGHPRAAETVARVDAKRLTYLAGLLKGFASAILKWRRSFMLPALGWRRWAQPPPQTARVLWARLSIWCWRYADVAGGGASGPLGILRAG